MRVAEVSGAEEPGSTWPRGIGISDGRGCYEKDVCIGRQSVTSTFLGVTAVLVDAMSESEGRNDLTATNDRSCGSAKSKELTSRRRNERFTHDSSMGWWKYVIKR